LTDNGKVFTGRFNHPPVEVLFDAICRENGIDHLLTQPRSPTTTGKIERFHGSMRAEFLDSRAAFTTLAAAQQALDEWVQFYNTARPHQAIGMLTPAQRFSAGPSGPAIALPAPSSQPQRTGSDWDSRRVTTNGVVCASWQQASLGRHYAGSRCDVHVDGDLLRFFVGDVLVKPPRETNGPSAPANRPRTKHRVLRDQPNQIRQASTDVEKGHQVPSQVSAVSGRLPYSASLLSGRRVVGASFASQAVPAVDECSTTWTVPTTFFARSLVLAF
jgi:hypothetical protein